MTTIQTTLSNTVLRSCIGHLLSAYYMLAPPPRSRSLGPGASCPMTSVPLTLISREGVVKCEEQLVNRDWEEMEASAAANSVIDAS